MDRASPPLVLKPSAGARTWVWALAAFGAIFGLSGTAAGQLPVAIAMGAFGLTMIVIAVNAAIGKLTCDRTELRWRTLRTIQVPASEITAVTVQSIPGYGYRRVRIDVHRQTGRPLKLTGLQRADTPKNLAKSEADADAIRNALGLQIPAGAA